MKKPRALDLFCCAGGAGMGLHKAGFDVVGVDIKPQSRYPFEFHQADALTYPLDGFDFVWASPPCQGYTAMRHAPGAKGTAPQLIDRVRTRLKASGKPWCIENVEEAAWAMRDPVTLCGSMFRLGAQGCRLQRHRLFECSFKFNPPVCRHDARPVIGARSPYRWRIAAASPMGWRGSSPEANFPGQRAPHKRAVFIELWEAVLPDLNHHQSTFFIRLDDVPVHQDPI
jgi:DNA (cytosine-5)-methyltransferase 1